MPNPPLPPGSKIDKSSDYFRYWPKGGQPSLWKLNDNLVLAIPPQYQPFWYQKDDVTRAPMPLNQVPHANQTGFTFFMPDFGGFTPDNYKHELNEDKVEILEIGSADPAQAKPGAPGSYPPNMLKGLVNAGLNLNEYQEMYGLKCYHAGPGMGQRAFCYGQRDVVTGEDILFDVYVPPYRPNAFPLMQAEYFTRRYGGLRIVWRAHAKNWPRWHDIDAQIWKFVDAWNVAAPVPIKTH
jgi:hypothetical protein